MLNRKRRRAKADVIDEGPADAPAARRGTRASPRNLALNWLSRREHTQAELRTKLAQRDFSPAEIDTVLATLAAEGLVSDERFVESFIAARRRKGQGPVRIRMELQQHGLGAGLIDQHLDARGSEWVRLAREVRQKKFGAELPAEFADKARQMRFLEYRGFSSAQIRSAMNEE